MSENNSKPVNPETVTSGGDGIDRSLLSWADKKSTVGAMLDKAIFLCTGQDDNAGVALQFLAFVVDPSVAASSSMAMLTVLGEKLIHAVTDPIQDAMNTLHANCKGGHHVGPDMSDEDADALIATIRMTAAHNMADLCASWPAVRDALSQHLAPAGASSA